MISIGNSVGGSTPADADPAYAGIKGRRRDSFIPAKPSKNRHMTEKAYNKELARRRAVIEHVNAEIKPFNSMAYPCRGASPQQPFSENGFDLCPYKLWQKRLGGY